MQFQLIAVALAALATASPLDSVFSKRLEGNLIGYNCSNFQTECLNGEDPQVSSGDPKTCDSEYTACEACATQEHSCRVGSGDNYSGQLNCTVSAQKCYEYAVSPGTTEGLYNCEAARDTCANAPFANESFCASQYSACQNCQSQENACRNGYEANESLCSSEATTCFQKAMSLN